MMEFYEILEDLKKIVFFFHWLRVLIIVENAWSSNENTTIFR